MKLTNENLDYSDCDPGKGNYPQKSWDAIVPDHLKAAVLKRKEAMRVQEEALRAADNRS